MKKSAFQQQHQFRPALGKFNCLIQKLNVAYARTIPKSFEKRKAILLLDRMGFPEFSMEIRAVIRSFRKHYKNKHPHMEVIDFIKALVSARADRSEGITLWAGDSCSRQSH